MAPLATQWDDRDDEVVLLEVEHLDGQGEKRQVGPVFLLEERHALEEARPDDALLDVRVLTALDVEKRVNGGLGEDLGQDLEDLLAPSLPRQPVMDEGDLRVFHRGNYNPSLPPFLKGGFRGPMCGNGVQDQLTAGSSLRPQDLVAQA